MCESEYKLMVDQAAYILQTSPDNVKIERKTKFFSFDSGSLNGKLFFLLGVVSNIESEMTILYLTLPDLNSFSVTGQVPVNTFYSDVNFVMGKCLIDYYAFSKIH